LPHPKNGYDELETVFGLIGVTFLVMCVLLQYMTGIIGGPPIARRHWYC